MIHFQCEHCCRKIAVKDEYAHKQGKCPECENIITIPGESTIIEFQCPQCNRKISVPKIYTGKKTLCPECKNTLVIPSPPKESKKENSYKKYSPGAFTLIDVPEELKAKSKPPALPDELERIYEKHPELEKPSLSEDQDIGKRTLPWLIDIFLYPTSASGLVNIAVFVVVISLLQILETYASAYARHYAGLLFFVFYLFLGGYMLQYFTECIRDSAAGGLRAPETLNITLSRNDILEQILTMFACYAVFLGPMVFYKGYTTLQKIEPNSIIFWSLWAYGIFFFPMGILAVAMFGSINALNPLLLIGSIFSTFFQYCALLIYFAFIGLLIVLASMFIPQMSIVTAMISSAIGFWLLFIAAHLLGRFYWRCQEKLNWEV